MTKGSGAYATVCSSVALRSSPVGTKLAAALYWLAAEIRLIASVMGLGAAPVSWAKTATPPVNKLEYTGAWAVKSGVVALTIFLALIPAALDAAAIPELAI